MSLLLYASLANASSRRLVSVMTTLAAKENIEIFHTPKSLARRLSQPNNYQAIVVLLASSEKEFSSVLSFQDLLQDTRLILILPNRDNQTISKGHNLRPRFVSYADSDFSDIGAVLRKMLKNAHSGDQDLRRGAEYSGGDSHKT